MLHQVKGPKMLFPARVCKFDGFKRDRFQSFDAFNQLSESKFLVRINLISRDPNRGLMSS